MAAVTDISLILFDLNGVLYRYDRAARIDYLAAACKRSAAAVKVAIWESGFEDSGDSGAMDAAAYLRGFGACIGVDLAETTWVAALRTAISPIPATLGLLPRIRPEVRCAVLTNNNLLVKRHFATLYPEIAAVMGERAYVSAEFAARKPDPHAYLRCLARLGVDPGAALFIDDSPANVEGARDAGLHGCDYTGPDELAVELKGCGVLFDSTGTVDEGRS